MLLHVQQVKQLHMDVIMSYNNIIDIHVALPPVTEMSTIVSVGKISPEGVVVITMGTATRSAVVSFTLSGVVCPKLNRKVCAADKSNVKNTPNKMKSAVCGLGIKKAYC